MSRTVARTIRKSIMSLMVLAICFSAAAGFTGCKKAAAPAETEQGEVILHESEYDLVKDGKSEYVIAIPKNADRIITFAASELQEFFALATGCELPIKTDAIYDENAKIVSIGNTTAWAACGITLSLDELGMDGTFITRRGKQVFLNGADSSGALNAAYDFLAHQFEYEAYAEDEIYVKHVTNAKLLDYQSLKNVPVIATRTPGSRSLINNEIYAARMRLCTTGGGKRFGKQDGEYVTYAHTIQYLLPKATYGEDHPDWYSSSGDQVCLPKYFTDEEFKTAFLDALKNRIKEHPESTAFQLGMNDNNGNCDRPETVEWTKARGGYSGALMTFANAVAKDIKEWLAVEDPARAEVFRISILAYIAYESAPVVYDDANDKYLPAHPDVVPADNVSVMLCGYYAENAYSLGSPENMRYKNLLRQWSSLTDNLEIWLYTTNFRNYMIPYNNFQSTKENLLVFEEYGVDYVMQNGTSIPVNPFQNLKNYMDSKLFWDPHQDVNAIVDDFLYNYYKNAYPYIKEYYDLVRTNYAMVEQVGLETNDKLPSGIYETDKQGGTKVWSYGFTRKANELIDKAYAAAENTVDPAEREKVMYRVMCERLAPRYFLIQLHSSYLPADELAALIDEFERDTAECGISQLDESGRLLVGETIATWRARLEV